MLKTLASRHTHIHTYKTLINKRCLWYVFRSSKATTSICQHNVIRKVAPFGKKTGEATTAATIFPLLRLACRFQLRVRRALSHRTRISNGFTNGYACRTQRSSGWMIRSRARRNSAWRSILMDLIRMKYVNISELQGWSLLFGTLNRSVFEWRATNWSSAVNTWKARLKWVELYGEKEWTLVVFREFLNGSIALLFRARQRRSSRSPTNYRMILRHTGDEQLSMPDEHRLISVISFQSESDLSIGNQHASGFPVSSFERDLRWWPCVIEGGLQLRYISSRTTTVHSRTNFQWVHVDTETRREHWDWHVVWT